MKKKALKAECSIGIVTCAGFVCKEVEEALEWMEKDLKILAKKHNLHIDGNIWFYPAKYSSKK